MSKFREILNDGDLILQVAVNKGLGKTSWECYRNLSEEVRVLEDHVRKAKAKYEELKYLHKVASINVSHKRKVLQEWSKYNTSIPMLLENEPSILEKIEGLKYDEDSKSKSNSKASPSSKASDNKAEIKESNASNRGKSGDNKRPGGNVSLLSLLANATIPASALRA